MSSQSTMASQSFGTLPRLMKRAICLMTIVPALSLAACGGSGSSTTSSVSAPANQAPTTISKAQFIKEGDGVCAEVNAALGTISGSGSGTTASSAVGQRAALYQGMMERLRGLTQPDDQTGLDQVLSAGDAIVSAEQKAQQAEASSDSTALASAESQATSAEATFASAASSFGFKKCGQGATTPTTTSTAPSTAAPSTPVAPATTTPAPVAPAPAGGTGGATGTGTGGGSGGATGTGGTSGGSGGVGPG